MSRMKSWESPRRGRRRNNKSKAASARIRQLKKRNKRFRQQLRKAKRSDSQSTKTPPNIRCEGFLFSFMPLNLREHHAPNKAEAPLELKPNHLPADSFPKQQPLSGPQPTQTHSRYEQTESLSYPSP